MSRSSLRWLLLLLLVLTTAFLAFQQQPVGSSGAATEAHRETLARQLATGVGGSVPIPFHPVDSLRLGSLEMTGLRVISMDVKPIGGPPGVGVPLLDDHRIVFDLPRRQIAFLPTD